jgi:hypothetical protein
MLKTLWTRLCDLSPVKTIMLSAAVAVGVFAIEHRVLQAVGIDHCEEECAFRDCAVQGAPCDECGVYTEYTSFSSLEHCIDCGVGWCYLLWHYNIDQCASCTPSDIQKCVSCNTD